MPDLSQYSTIIITSIITAVIGFIGNLFNKTLKKINTSEETRAELTAFKHQYEKDQQRNEKNFEEIKHKLNII